MWKLWPSETHETIDYNEQNVCNLCQSFDYKKQNIDWEERKKLLDQLIEKFRGKSDYDCMVPFQEQRIARFSFII